MMPGWRVTGSAGKFGANHGARETRIYGDEVREYRAGDLPERSSGRRRSARQPPICMLREAFSFARDSAMGARLSSTP